MFEGVRILNPAIKSATDLPIGPGEAPIAEKEE